MIDIEYENKIASLEDEVKKFKEASKKSEEKYLYAMADMDNIRKRATIDKMLNYNNGVKDTILKILPVVDDFERAFKHNELAEGGKLIYKKLVDTLSKIGVDRITISDDTDFNVDEHEAISMVGNSNKVIDEVEAGYKFNNNVIRYSKVIVG